MIWWRPLAVFLGCLAGVFLATDGLVFAVLLLLVANGIVLWAR